MICCSVGFFLLLENTYVVKNEVKVKRDIAFLPERGIP